MQNATATNMDSNMPPNIDAEGFIVCPKCQKSVKVGSGGIHNLRAHQAGAKCRERIAKQAKAGLEVKRQQKFTIEIGSESYDVENNIIHVIMLHYII